MTVEEIDKRIRHIIDIASDDEKAHVEEDELREDFIRYVSRLKIPIAKKAKKVLSTNKIRFSRWCV